MNFEGFLAAGPESDAGNGLKRARRPLAGAAARVASSTTLILSLRPPLGRCGGGRSISTRNLSCGTLSASA